MESMREPTQSAAAAPGIEEEEEEEEEERGSLMERWSVLRD